MLFQVRTQQRLGLCDAVLDERGARFEQTRVMRGELQLLCIGSVGAFGISQRAKVAYKLAPGIAEIRLEFQCSTERCDRFIAAPRRAKREAQPVMRCEPFRLQPRKRLEHGKSASQVACPLARNTEQQLRVWLPGYRLQDCSSLLRGKPGICRQQMFRARQCGLQGAGGLSGLMRIAAHGGVA